MLEAYSDLSDVEGIEFKIDPYRKWHVLESQRLFRDLITNILLVVQLIQKESFDGCYKFANIKKNKFICILFLKSKDIQ